MSNLNAVIGTVIASAIERAGRDAGADDLALGLLAGLRRVRAIVEGQAGYTAACGLDDSLHELFVEHALEAFAANRRGVAPMPLPKRSSRTPRACLILEDAAMSCVALNAYFQGNTALNVGVRIMAERLIGCLGGVPDWGHVLRVLRAPDRVVDDEGGDNRWVTTAVH